MQRVVVLGCGTGVGKTRVAVALLRELAQGGHRCIGLKPIESGVESSAHGPPDGSDAAQLADAGSYRSSSSRRHPLYALRAPVSPHLAARQQGIEIDLETVLTWATDSERELTPRVLSDAPGWSIIELAGGVFSPLSGRATNFELARGLDPATWVLVAADALGVLHEMSATLEAMRARGRSPDHVVLSGARPADASTGSNARELTALGIVTPLAVLERNDDRGIRGLVQHLVDRRCT